MEKREYAASREKRTIRTAKIIWTVINHMRSKEAAIYCNISLQTYYNELRKLRRKLECKTKRDLFLKLKNLPDLKAT